MKLLRYGDMGTEKTGALDLEGQVRDLSGGDVQLAGQGVSLAVLDRLKALDLNALPIVKDPGRIGPCLAWVPNFYAVGLNYTKHAEELGLPRPSEPILFSKSTSSLSGPYDPIVIPRGSEKTDWEIELGVIIGREALNVSKDNALNYIAGYCIVNDVSERAFQFDREGQWIKGKSAPTFGPAGPWLVTADEVPDPQNLELVLSVNGETMQSSNTNDMIFSLAEIISCMSQYMKLVPGDLIATGTPPGIGGGRKPPKFLKAGDVMELTIDGLGQQRQEVVAAD